MLDGAQRASWLAQHPDLAPAPLERLHLAWHRGFVRRVTIGNRDDGSLFEHPALRFASELVLLDQETPARIADYTRRMPHLRWFAFGDPDRRHYRRPADELVYDLAAIAPLAQLEYVFSFSATQLAAAPRLRELRLIGDPDALPRLQTASLPALEILAIHDRRSGPLGWLCTEPPPNLVELDLADEVGDQIIDELVGTPLLAQLKRLRLWSSGVTAGGARTLRRACGHLDLLDVSDPIISDEVIEILDGACREVRTISPWMRQILRRPG